jgi:integrase
VTFENCRDYRDFLIGEHDLASSTIGNYLKALKALFNYAFDNYPDDFPTNAMARIKYQAGDGEERDDFTPEERVRILTAAREAGPVIRWLNWLSSFNGGRLSELVEADTRDIVMKEGVWVMEIKKTIRIPDQRRKTKVSSHDAPLHSALLAEGFLEYVESIKKEYGDGPLFPQVSLDAYGRRNGKVSKPISKWLRNVVGIKDPKKTVPFASPYGDLLFAQHPPSGWRICRQNGYRTISARPFGKGFPLRLWQAMDRDPEGGDRDHTQPASSATSCR